MIETAPAVASEPREQSSADAVSEPQAPAPDASLVESELLVEDVSIDGMCGVY